MWFDSHCHLQDRYVRADDAEGRASGTEDIAALLAEAARLEVDRLICIGTDAESSLEALDLAAGRGGSAPQVWASVGLHPHEAASGTDSVVELARSRRAAGDTTLVAIGECGLDYHYLHSPVEDQRRAFATQIRLARELELTLVIHARSAWDDLFEVMGGETLPERVVLHCFTGGPPELARCLAAGMWVSFSGIVTFKNAADVQAAAAQCPLDRLLIETDSPFLAPVPHRGQANEPAFVPYVGEAIAAIKGIDVPGVAEVTAANAATAFNV